jgi:hypothetical protein
MVRASVPWAGCADCRRAAAIAPCSSTMTLSCVRRDGPAARHIVDFQETGQPQLMSGQLRISRALDLAERGRSIAALRRKIEHSRHPERLATPDKTR